MTLSILLLVLARPVCRCGVGLCITISDPTIVSAPAGTIEEDIVACDPPRLVGFYHANHQCTFILVVVRCRVANECLVEGICGIRILVHCLDTCVVRQKGRQPEEAEYWKSGDFRLIVADTFRVDSTSRHLS